MAPWPSAARRLRVSVLFFLCLALPIVSAQPTPSPSLTGCQACATYQDCSRAYYGGPGKHCGSWSDPQTLATKQCCCPVESTCELTTSSCRCHMDASGFGPVPTPAPSPSLSSGAWIGVGVGIATFVSLVIFMCWCIARKVSRPPSQGQAPPASATARPIMAAVPRAMPVQGYSGNPPQRATFDGGNVYEYSALPTAPVYDYGNSYGYTDYHHHHHHHSGVSAGVGAAVGVAAGVVVADIVTDGFSHGGGYHYGGGSDSGGGYVAADSGGYSGGYDGGGGGYDGGDGGGGGGDGGGGDCGGDS